MPRCMKLRRLLKVTLAALQITVLCLCVCVCARSSGVDVRKGKEDLLVILGFLWKLLKDTGE